MINDKLSLAIQIIVKRVKDNETANICNCVGITCICQS